MKISVVTVSRNSSATIADTIRSFLAQTHDQKELVVIDGLSTDDTVRIVRSYGSPNIMIVSELDKGPYDAMNKGLHLFTGDAVGILNSDDAFHDNDALSAIAEGLTDFDIAYGDVDMVTDHKTKRLVRAWQAGQFKRRAFQYGWTPPHPAFYMRRCVVEQVRMFDLNYPMAADYDFMLRAMALHNFRIRYLPRVLVDFQLGGISTRNWQAALQGNLECLKSRRANLRAPVVDAALFLRPLRRIFQLRRVSHYLFR